ncbi:MAG: transposase [Clostridia bacterium]|nr:transposase [Clostridia bacterium]
MSIPKQDHQATFYDASLLAHDLFDKKDRYDIFRKKILPALQVIREDLCKLYCPDNGRPGIEPVLMAGVTLLQFMEAVPDRKAVEQVRLHLGWKHALSLKIDYAGFHPTTLVTFRDRLTGHQDGRLIFDSILQALHKNGLVKRRGKQRLDSTHILGAVSRMGRLEVVRETIRLFLETVRKMGMQALLDDWAVFYERYIDCDIAWHKASIETLKTKFEQAGRDMLSLLDWAGKHPVLLKHPQGQLLRRVFSEQYELTEQGPKRRKHEGSGVVKNPHDPDVQWSSKDRDHKKNWEGYKAQIAETVPEGNASGCKKGRPTTGFITEVTTTQAITSDFAGRKVAEERQKEHGLGIADELYVDAGYINDDALGEAHRQERTLMGPARPSSNPSGELFTAEDFDVSVSDRQAICPAGHKSTQCSRLENGQTSQVDYRFEWSYHCDDCPLQSKCTKARSGRRMLVVGEHHDSLQQRRKEMRTESFQKAMHQRNGIEGTISEFARTGGRRTRYRGLSKTSLCNYLHGSAINAKRWIRLLQYQTTEVAISA